MLKYEEPRIEMLVLGADDVIVSSGDPTGGWDGEGDPIDIPSVGI